MLEHKKLAGVSENCSKYARRDAIARAADVAIEVSNDRREETASMIDDVLDLMMNVDMEDSGHSKI
jgi:flavin-binding protein dodecin